MGRPRIHTALSHRHSATPYITFSLLCLLMYSYHQLGACQHAHVTPSITQQGSSAPRPLPGTIPGAPDTRAPPHLRNSVWAWLQFAVADAEAAGVTGVSAECLQAQGVPFLERFQSTCGRVCGRSPADRWPASTVDCCAYPVDNTGAACVAANLAVHAAAFMGPRVSKGEQAHHKYLPAGQPGSVQLQCSAQEESGSQLVRQDRLGSALKHEHLPWFKAATVHSHFTPGATLCSRMDTQAVRHPVMFVSRLDTTNPYHHTQVKLVQLRGQPFFTKASAAVDICTRRQLWNIVPPSAQLLHVAGPYPSVSACACSHLFRLSCPWRSSIQAPWKDSR